MSDPGPSSAALDRATYASMLTARAERAAIIAGIMRRSASSRVFEARWNDEQQRFYDWAIALAKMTAGEQESVFRKQLPPWVQTYTALEPAGLARTMPGVQPATRRSKGLWRSMGGLEFARAEDMIANPPRPTAIVDRDGNRTEINSGGSESALTGERAD